MQRDRSFSIRTVLLVASVAFAGCADDGGDAPAEEDAVDKDSFELESGKGAIAGLLVDDRYRPIDLEDAPQTEFQAEGFVLLQETGQQVKSNENGEFTFVDLEPGRYTLRVTAEGHEAAPRAVTVEEGVFAEATVIARRVASTGGFTISNEFSAFVACGANVVAYGTSFDCTGDQSGDSSRESFTIDYTEYNATHMVMEMHSNQEQFYDIWLQPPGNQVCSGAYQIMGGPETTYLRFQLDIGEAAVSSEGASGAGCQTLVWDNAEPLQTVVYLNSPGFEQGVGFGAGVYTGVQANFVQTLFIGEPEVDVDAYCVFCE